MRERLTSVQKGRTFLAQGGKGKLTEPQVMLADALGLPVEYAIPTAAVWDKFPSLSRHYMVDIADLYSPGE